MKKRLFGGPHGLAAPAGALLFCIALLGFTGCESDPLPSEENKVISFKVDGIAGSIDQDASTITIEFPDPEKDLSEVYPEITLSKNATLVDPEPNSEDPETAWNLDNPRRFEVLSENGDFRTYRVTATKKVVLKEIKLKSEPKKLAYKPWESIATKDLSVVGIYSDDSSKEEEVYTLSPAHALGTPGLQEVKVEVGGITTSFTITVADVELESIAVAVQKAIYTQSDTFDPAKDIVVTGSYDDGTTVIILPTDVVVTGYNNALPGEQTLVATAKGKGAEFKVTVIALESIEVTVLKRPYVLNEPFDPTTDIVVTGTYTDGSTKIETIAADWVTGYDPTKPGEQTLVATVRGKKKAFTVEVVALESIEVTVLKAMYAQGDMFDPATDIVVTGTYTDGSTKIETIAAEDVTGYDGTKPGEQTLVATVGGKKTAFTVEVVALESIAVTVLKNIYAQNDPFNPATDIVVTGTYTDGSTKIEAIAAEDVTGYNGTKPGEQTLVATVGGKKAAFTVEVAALESINVTPVKTKYLRGEALDPATNIVVTGTYTDGSTITETVYDVIGYDRDKTTETETGTQPQTLTVIKDGKTATYTVTVVDLDSDDPIAVDVLKTKYALGEAFDAAGIVVSKVYTDSSKVKVDISAADVTGYDPLKLGDQILTVTVEGRTKTFTVTVETEQAIGVAIGWPGTDGEPEIFGIPDGGIVLSTGKNNDLPNRIVLSAAATGTTTAVYDDDSIKWYVDGGTAIENNIITIEAENYTLKTPHYITFTGTKGGVEYSKTITFTVNH